MTDSCPHLDHRHEAGDLSFETARPYCEIQSAFVEPMRADICRARYDLRPRTDCEIYRDHHEGD